MIKPCNRCGSLEKNSKRECRPCAVKRSALWRANNKNREKETHKIWNGKNKESIAIKAKKRREDRPEIQKAAVARWAKNNKEKRVFDNALLYKKNKQKKLEMSKKWALENRDKRVLSNQKRRAIKLQNKGILSKDIVKTLLLKQKGLCTCCGLPIGLDFHLDHIMPLALGGAHADINMQLLRKVCNLQKGKKHPLDFIKFRNSQLGQAFSKV